MAENREKCPKLPHWVFSCFSHKNRFGYGLKGYMSIIKTKIDGIIVSGALKCYKKTVSLLI